MQVATEELTTAGPTVVKLFNVLFSVSVSSQLTQHPCAVGPTFYLLRLALRHAQLVGSQGRGRLHFAHEVSPPCCHVSTEAPVIHRESSYSFPIIRRIFIRRVTAEWTSPGLQ